MWQVVSLLNSDDNVKKNSGEKNIKKGVNFSKDFETENSDDVKMDLDDVPAATEIEDLINFEKTLAGFTSRDDSVSGTFIRY